MDKNTIIGFVLIGLVIFVFSWMNQPNPEQIEAQRRIQDSLALVEKAKQAKEEDTQKNITDQFANLPDSVREKQMFDLLDEFALLMKGEDKTTTLENDFIRVTISNRGGRVLSASLKKYDNYKNEPVVLFNDKDSRFSFSLVTASNVRVNTDEMYFKPYQVSDSCVSMRAELSGGRYLEFLYQLKSDSYMLDFSVKGVGLNGTLSPSSKSLDMFWQQRILQQEKGRMFEDRYAQMYYKIKDDDVEYLSESKNDNRKEENPLQWVAYKDMYFSTILIADGEDGFNSVELSSKMLPKNGHYLKEYKMTGSVPFDLTGNKATDLHMYLGPNYFPLLKSYDQGIASSNQLELEKIVPLGWGIFRWVNQYFVIPLFNFLGKYISSYGLVILILTIIIKVILFPLTRKSYLSTAKMRVLRPQVEEINAKYPNQDQAMERQKETMDLYSRAGASPMSGCVPMLLQFPILVAMFMFFPSAIELRHQSFLWAEDLSTYDAIVSWNANIPFITSYFGNHISLFCLLMTITNILYTKFNMDQTNTGQPQMPGMKIMMYFMPIFMMVFFNQYASGLTYYYFISLLITIVQTLIFRYTINEEKLLAKLEENKRRPQKKSTFMKRLEEAQKMQQEQLDRQKQMREKNRRR